MLCPSGPLAWRSCLLDPFGCSPTFHALPVPTALNDSAPYSFAGCSAHHTKAYWSHPWGSQGAQERSVGSKDHFVSGTGQQQPLLWIFLFPFPRPIPTPVSLSYWWQGQAKLSLKCLWGYSSIVLDNRSWHLFRWLTNLFIFCQQYLASIEINDLSSLANNCLATSFFF